MKILRIIIYLIAIVTVCSSAARADLKFRNGSRDTVVLAIAFVQNGVQISQGWFVLAPGETKSVTQKQTPNHIFYYYAAAKSYTWQGSNLLCVSTTQPVFTCPAAPSVVKTGFKLLGFIKVDIGTKDYTVALIPGYDASQFQHPSRPIAPSGGVESYTSKKIGDKN